MCLYPREGANYGWIKGKCADICDVAQVTDICTLPNWCQLMSINSVSGWNWSTLDETVHTNSKQWMVARIQISYILSRCAAAKIQCWWPQASPLVNQHCISAAAHLDRIYVTNTYTYVCIHVHWNLSIDRDHCRLVHELLSQYIATW